MQTILIPTDFKMEALNCVDALCQHNEDDLTLIFIHMIKLSDSITELLMLSRRRRDVETVSDQFYDRCSALSRENKKIKSIRVEFFYGSTMSMFRNFLEANEVDAILNPCDCSISKLHAASVDPVALINKCGLPIVDISTVKPVQQTETARSTKEEALEAEIAY